MDPQISYTAEGWTAMRPVYVPLLTYKPAAGEEGAEIIPGLAKELPKVTNGGKTYTLFLNRASNTRTANRSKPATSNSRSNAAS